VNPPARRARIRRGAGMPRRSWCRKQQGRTHHAHDCRQCESLGGLGQLRSGNLHGIDRRLACRGDERGLHRPAVPAKGGGSQERPAAWDDRLQLLGRPRHGVYTLWNVLETNPFKDEPLGEFGVGKHSVVADGSGRAHKVVVLDKWPGKEFLLDYHADGQLSQATGVYPGALWGRFPVEPKR